MDRLHFLKITVFLLSAFCGGILYAQPADIEPTPDKTSATPYTALPAMMINLNRFSSELLFGGVGVGDIIGKGLADDLIREEWVQREEGKPEASSPSHGDYDSSGLWVDYLGCTGHAGSGGSGLDYGIKDSGFVLGTRFPTLDGFKLSFASVFGSSTLIPASQGNGQTEVDRVRLGFMGRRWAGPWEMGLSVQYAWDYYRVTRPIAGGSIGPAQAFFTGREGTASFQLSRAFRWEENLLEPMAELQYTRLWMDGFTETGAGDQNLSAGGQNYRSLQPVIGIMLSRELKVGREGRLMPTLALAVSRELLDIQPQVPVGFANASSPVFTVTGSTPDPMLLNLGGGLTLTFEGFFLYADFNGVFGDSLNLNTYSGGTGLVF